MAKELTEEEKEARRERRRQRKAEREQEIQDGATTGTISSKPSKVQTISASERGKFEKMIEQRAEILNNTIDHELDTSTSTIESIVLKELGLEKPVSDYKDDIIVLESELDDAIQPVIAQEEEAIIAEMAELKDELEQQKMDLNDEIARRKQELKKNHDAKREALQRRRNALQEKVGNEKYPDLVARLKDAQSKYQNALALEPQIKSRRVAHRETVTNQRYKIMSFAKDAIARAKEQIYTIETRAQATLVLNSIPTGTELLQMFSTNSPMDAVKELFKSLIGIQQNTNLLLAAPEGEPQPSVDNDQLFDNYFASTVVQPDLPPEQEVDHDDLIEPDEIDNPFSSFDSYDDEDEAITV